MIGIHCLHSLICLESTLNVLAAADLISKFFWQFPQLKTYTETSVRLFLKPRGHGWIAHTRVAYYHMVYTCHTQTFIHNYCQDL